MDASRQSRQGQGAGGERSSEIENEIDWVERCQLRTASTVTSTDSAPPRPKRPFSPKGPKLSQSTPSQQIDFESIKRRILERAEAGRQERLLRHYNSEDHGTGHARVLIRLTAPESEAEYFFAVPDAQESVGDLEVDPSADRASDTHETSANFAANKRP